MIFSPVPQHIHLPQMVHRCVIQVWGGSLQSVSPLLAVCNQDDVMVRELNQDLKHPGLNPSLALKLSRWPWASHLHSA